MPDPVLRFEYPGPQADDGRGEPGRKHFYLFKTERAVSEIQVFERGAKNTLHYHPGEDGVWIVLAGRATFYTEGDRVLGELGPLEGLLIPAGTRYWFESAGDEPLQVLRVDYRVPKECEVPEGSSGVEVRDSYGNARWSPYADAEHQAAVARRGEAAR